MYYGFFHPTLCYNQTSGDSFIKDRAFLHLTSRSPENFWTSGQWMTERGGGSDVGMHSINQLRT